RPRSVEIPRLSREVCALDQPVGLDVLSRAVLRPVPTPQALDPVALDVDHAVLHDVPQFDRPVVLRDGDLLSLDRPLAAGHGDLVMGTEVESAVLALDVHDRLRE